MPLEAVQDVQIDADGVFKYILIELKDKKGKTKTIVRGFKWAEYHGKHVIFVKVCQYTRLPTRVYVVVAQLTLWIGLHRN